MDKEVEKNFKKMIDDIEKRMAFYLPLKWDYNKVKFFINKIKFDFDLNAFNQNFNEPARDFLFRGGKRWRPLLFLLILKLFGKNYKNYLDVAVAIELAHNATLIIDDIEDNAMLRRGDLTCHRKFGLDTAVNTGTLLLFLPLQILAKSKLPSKQLQEIFKIYIEEITNIHFGQTIDIYWHKQLPSNIDAKKYMEMCRLKTGGLVKMALRIACVLTKKDKNIEKKFVNFSELIGIAFQIKDDILDLTQNKSLGKSYGNDITEGKISLPVILALKKLNPRNSKRLIKILKMHTRNRKLISEAISLINRAGAIESASKFANGLINKAWKEIKPVLPSNQASEELRELISFLIKRNY